MMKGFLASYYLATSILAASLSTHESFVHETAAVPNGWYLVGDADEAAHLQLSVALTQSRLGELKKRLAEISDITSDDFGAHLSQAQLREYQTPDEESVFAVLDWLREGGINDARVDSAWIRMNTTVHTINTLLNCQMHEYETSGSTQVYRSTEYSLPSDLARHIQFIYPITQFIKTTPRILVQKEDSNDNIQRRQASIPTACDSYTSADCLTELYNITYVPQDSTSGSTLGIGGFLEEYPSQDSLKQFLETYSPRRNDSGWGPEYNFTVLSINGGNDTNAGSGGEALLDTFYSMVFTQPLPVTYLSTGGRGQYIDPNGNNSTNTSSNSNEPWLEFLEGLLALNDDTLPKVLSLSYTDDEQSIPFTYAVKICDLFAQLAARGVSVLVASGDGGAYGLDSTCTVNSGPDKGQPRFLATFPASCPYVTAVGATGLYEPIEPTSWSSGGFSEYFEQPEWQVNDTTKYIAGLNGTHDGWYNPSGRGYPDLTLTGVRYLLGDTFTTKGTSASTPVWAAMIVLINDHRLRAGKPALGYLNPIIYSEQVRAALYDVTSGNVGGCTNGGDSQVEIGWSATEGWDPASGLGTPEFQALLEVLG